MVLKHKHLINRSSALGVLVFSACAMSQTSSADVSTLIGSQVKRSEFCTGFNDHHAGFVQYVTTAYPVLADEQTAEATMGKFPKPDSPIEVLALTVSRDALPEARLHSGWVEMSRADSAKVLCFAALSSYDNFLSSHPNEKPSESGLIAAEQRIFKTLAGLSAGY
jgi:hypothetical protein